MFEPSKLLNLKQPLAQSNVAWFADLYADIRLSPGQKRLASWIAAGNTSRDLKQGVAKVGRGCGKTEGVGTGIAHLHAFDKTWKISVISGSYEQARYMYAYYEPYLEFTELFPPDCFKYPPTKNLVQFKAGGFLRILSASEFRARGGHVDVLCLDEAVLMKPDLIKAVVPSIRASSRPILIVTSTATRKISYRWFINLWQNSKTLDFERFEWSPEECHWISKKVTERLSKLFDKATVTVELFGGIAEYKGFVFSGKAIDSCIVDPFNEDEWPEESAPPLTNWHWCNDWGFTHPNVTGDLEMRSDIVFVRDIRIREEAPIGEIIDELTADFKDKPGYTGNDGAGEIKQLQTDGLDVTPVAFSTDKALLISELKRRFERRLIRLPDPDKLEVGDPAHDIDGDPAKAQEFRYLIDELHNYHYDDNGKPAKVDDDSVDMLLYGMKPLIPSEHRRDLGIARPATRR